MNKNEDALIHTLAKLGYNWNHVNSHTTLPNDELFKVSLEDQVSVWGDKENNKQINSKLKRAGGGKRLKTRKSAPKDLKKLQNDSLHKDSTTKTNECKNDMYRPESSTNKNTKMSYLPPLLKQKNCSPPSHFTITNKSLRSTGVLSYDIPSWRFLSDLKSFKYIDRQHPKDIFGIEQSSLRYVSSANVNVRNNGQKKMPVDPALFIDEKLAVSYKALKSYYIPVKQRQQASVNVNITWSTYGSLNERLLPISTISKKETSAVVGLLSENEGNNMDQMKQMKKNLEEKSPKKRKNLSMKKCCQNDKKKYLPNQPKSKIVLPKLNLPTLQARSQFMKGANKIYNSKVFNQREISKQLKEKIQSKESYVPTLSFYNYQPNLCVPFKVESKKGKCLPFLTPLEQPVLNMSPSISKVNLL